jgi:hypothetical protein
MSPLWTMVPFGVLVLSVALMPMLWPHAWEKVSVQASIRYSLFAFVTMMPAHLMMTLVS